MSGRHKFSKLREEMDADPERRKRMEEKKRAFDALLDLAELAELRKSRRITQAELAERLGVSQPNVAKIEAAGKRDAGEAGYGAGYGAVHLSTLAGYVEALGGRLEVRATFPEHPETDVAVPIGAAAAEDEVPAGQGPLGTRED